MIDLACSIGLITSTLVVGVAYAGRVTRAGAARHARIERAGSSPLLAKGAMEMGYWAMAPVARFLIALGFTANAVSWLSLALAGGAGVALALGHFGIGAMLSVVSSVCDAIDGFIARETRTASDSGEVLDATVDRYAELFFLGGIAVHERHDALTLVLTLAATAGAMMVSYSTAKAEALGVEPPRGAMRRQERAVYFVLGAGFVPVVAAAATRWGLPAFVDRWPLLAMLALVAVVGNVSAVRRLRAVADAVRKPAPEPLSRPSPGWRPEGEAEALARDAHAAAGDALR
ncbi:MAG TPA: CDP-alcohol phosphatidyltransferase family protein [Polyangiaceae bacterium]|nr:CDP-alcohol phosphatidyltransferase family protein [Polyangiaceae bacterium]